MENFTAAAAPVQKNSNAMADPQPVVIDTVVIRLHPTREPGFDFLHQLATCMCFCNARDAVFETLAPGMKVRLEGQWSEMLVGLFECERVTRLDPAGS
jgi:hypothetical protein